MNRRLFLLNGLAILGVVVSHAAGWGQIAMENWIGHIRETVAPNYACLGGMTYYVTLSIRQITVFSVAALLYAAGWFITYVVGKAETLKWKAVQARIEMLLIPYLIWSVVIFISDFALGQRYTLWEYIWILFTTGATGPYYYVPLLCYLYLLSFFLVPLAKKHWKGLLIVTGFIQFVTMGIQYLYLLDSQSPWVVFLWKFTPDWSLPRWIFYFTFGMVSGFHASEFKDWIIRVRKPALITLIITAILVIAEYDIVFRNSKQILTSEPGFHWGDVPLTISTTIYSLAVIICFQAYNMDRLPFSKALYQLSIKSYGIYLIHMKLYEAAARITYHVLPILLTIQVIYQPMLLLIGFGGTLLFMSLVSKSPARKYYRYLFG